MKLTKKITALFLLFALFVSNVGFILQSSCCIENTKLIVNVFNNDCCCEADSDVIEECCSVPIQQDISEDKCGEECFVLNEYKKLDINQVFNDVIKFQNYFIPIATIENEESDLKNFNNTFLRNSSFLITKDWGRAFIISNHTLKIPHAHLA